MAETGKTFLKKLVGFSLVTWISFALSFLTAPISTRLFAPEVLGKINIFNTYSNLFGILILMGLDQAFVRFYHERPSDRSLNYLFTFCFGITYALLSGLIILSLPIRSYLSWELFEESDNLLLYLFFFSIFCSSSLRYLNLSYRMEQNIKMYTIQGVLMTLVSKVLYIGVGFWDPSYRPALIALTISHVLLAVLFLYIQKSRFERIREYDSFFTKEMFKYALPLVPVSVLMWANTSIPQIVMQKTMDYKSIGIFTSAVSLANIILIVQAGFSTFWVPYVYENYKTQTGQFFKVHRYLLCVLTICALLLVLSQDIIFMLLGEKYRGAKLFFPFLILGPVCYIIGETTGIGIDISKKTYFNIIVFGGSIIINLLSCLILKQPFGVSGIAMAVALAGVIAMGLRTFIGQKYYQSIYNYQYVYITITLIVISAFVNLYVQHIYWKMAFLFSLFVLSLLLFKKEIIELKDYSLSFFHK